MADGAVGCRLHDCFAVPDEHEPRRCLRTEQTIHGRDGGCGDLVLVGCRNQIDPGSAQRSLARDGSLFLPNEPGHSRDDEQEQHGGCDDQHQDVGVVQRLGEADRGRYQARTGEEDAGGPV